ncbi:MAG: hypothetical protein Q9N34_06065 [Aquificota bacterium]|nr:hypothetical protein [Aquificota bacterium]
MIHDVEEFLKAHYPFSKLPESALGALSYHILVRYYQKEEIVFEEGSRPLDYLYIVRKGAIVLLVDGGRGGLPPRG